MCVGAIGSPGRMCVAASAARSVVSRHSEPIDGCRWYPVSGNGVSYDRFSATDLAGDVVPVTHVGLVALVKINLMLFS